MPITRSLLSERMMTSTCKFGEGAYSPNAKADFLGGGSKTKSKEGGV
jgi:hypothetical protein